MDKYDGYRQQAADAQKQADAAKTEDDRAAWLRIAQGWLGLLSRRRLTASEVFESESKARGTRQEDSEASH